MTAFAPVAMADIPAPTAKEPAISESDRMSLARDFLSRVKKGFANADRDYALKHETNADKARRLPEGEDLLLNIRFPDERVTVDSSILGRAQNGQIVLSLRDFVLALEFPVEFDEAGNAKGWYIREKNAFVFDRATKTVTSGRGSFPASNDIVLEEGDVLVPIDELAAWFGFELDLNVAALEMALTSPVKLPIQERIARGKFRDNRYRVGPPKLPLHKDDPKAIDYPFVDVSSRSSYSKDGETGEGRTLATSAIRTTGDFAYGTLTTQTTLEKDEKLTNLRLNYKRESLEKELLGPLKARKYELGDVTPPDFALRNNDSQGVGVRVTDAHPLRNTLRPSTGNHRTSFPGWDVELYRDEQLLSFQTIGDDGVYRFQDVDLFNEDNNFRLVFYGLQGEIREEEVSIPVDTTRLADMGSAYDIAVSAKDMQTYRKASSANNEDEGSPSFQGIFEAPIGENTVGLVGLEAFQENGAQKVVAHTGVSTALAGVLVNLDGAVDQDNEAGAQLVCAVKSQDIRSGAKPTSRRKNSTLTRPRATARTYSLTALTSTGHLVSASDACRATISVSAMRWRPIRTRGSTTRRASARPSAVSASASN